ncbi:MAG: NAD-dependent epimerase/dehydratase family protein [Bacteroidota bacterium]|nr:NAD-dependent epimerase/dehydratase family protein [Candidatus Kapabacteria bacterium]MDW8219892.1 NAD-dependent epimerase/dehydratase family protein [Bacteroidota bacterium]
MLRILVTGGAGFIGQALARRLSDDPQYHIVVADNLVRGRLDADMQELIRRPNVEFVEGNVASVEFFDTLPTNFDYIYHLAAVIGVRNVIENPDKVLSVNALSTLHVCEYAKRLPHLRRILFSSTSEVYAGTLKYFSLRIPTPETEPLTLDDITAPRTTYMLSKIYGEAVCCMYGKLYDVPYTIVRYHNVYGPRMGFLHVIPEMFVKIRDHEIIDVASPYHTRAFCYIDDAVTATILAAEHDATQGEIVNIGNSSEEVSIRELVQNIAHIMGKEIRIQELPDTPGSPRRRCPDISKIQRLTGFKPRVCLRDGITRTYAWYKDRLDARHE